MKTKVLRIDLFTAQDIAAVIAQACDAQLAQGFKLASTFTWQNSLILIFQFT